jgi:single-strand DNA-binding protein
MVAFNRVVLTGNLTRDPELRFTREGVPVAGFGLAVNRVRSKSEEVDFFDVSAWRELGETVANYKKKGDPILLEGRLQYRTWEAQDGSGAKRSKVDVVADNIQFLGSGAGKGNGEGANGSSKGSAGSSARSSAGSSAGSSRSGGRTGQGQQTDEESYEDIPFAQGYDPTARIVREIL